MPFYFSLIRFVPDPARGEFVNIGAVAGNDQAGEWQLRLVSNLARAKALDDRGVLSKAVGFAASMEDHIAALGQPPIDGQKEVISKGLLDQLSADMQNVVQFTAPAPIAVESAEAALDFVFDQLVLDMTRKQFTFEKKHRAQGAARQAYGDSHIPPQAIKERASVQSGVYDSLFDFAVHNGKAVQLVQCWSFQLPNQADLAEQVKAWSWVVHELRSRGGQLCVNDHALDVPSGLDIFAVAIPPADGEAAPAYAEAQAAFAEIEVCEISPEDASILGQRAASELGVS